MNCQVRLLSLPDAMQLIAATATQAGKPDVASTYEPKPFGFGSKMTFAEKSSQLFT